MIDFDFPGYEYGRWKTDPDVDPIEVNTDHLCNYCSGLILLEYRDYYPTLDDSEFCDCSYQTEVE